ncbi:MAG: HAD-IA family hydrolase [bacterium]
MKSDIKCVVFDLDGTLFSSHKNIYFATLKTFKDLNINAVINETEFYKKIGLHFKDIFDEMNIEVEDVEHFIDVYKTNYFKFINESEPYPNLFEILEYLFENNIKIGLLTTKSQEQAELILDHFKIIKYFDMIIGRRFGMEIKPSPQPLLHIADFLNLANNQMLMVGDSEMDIMCGKNAGIKSCAVTYGYRTCEELKEHNPDFIIDNLEELKNII